MREDQIKVGWRAKPESFKRLGYKRLSSTTWVKNKSKVQVIMGRIKSITGQQNFNQPIFSFRSKNHRHEQISREVLKLLKQPSPLKGL